MLDSNLNQVLAKVSPSLLRRRSPSPSAATTNHLAVQRDSQGGSSGASGGNSSTSSSSKKSEQFLSPPTPTDGGVSEVDGKGKPPTPSPGDVGSSQKSGSNSDPLGAVAKGQSTAGAGKSKNKIPNQAKKKSWYSVFYPSYKSRSADFKKLFKEVPDDERLLVGEWYSWEKLTMNVCRRTMGVPNY